MKNIDVAQIVKKVKTGDFYKHCALPLGYVDGYPVLSIKNSKLCLVIPFLKYKVTGEVDKTLVYPIRYLITVSVEDEKVIGFENLEYAAPYRKIDFEKPIGFFRHEAVKKYNKNEFKEKRAELYDMYSKVAMAILYNAPYTENDDAEFKELLNTLLEPSLRPIYAAIDKDFNDNYLA